MINMIDTSIRLITESFKEVVKMSTISIQFNIKAEALFEPRCEKTCSYHMRTTKVQISLRIHAV